MRLVGIGLAAALALDTTPAATQGVGRSIASSVAESSIAAAPLAAGEVLLEVDATGSTRTPADRTVVTVPLVSRAATAAEARAANEQLLQRVVAAARSVGTDPDRIRIVPTNSPLGFLSEPAEAAFAVAIQGGEAAESTQEMKVLEIELGSVPYERLRDALEGAGAQNVGRPVYSLTDDGQPRRRARALAIAAAKADAESYAEIIGMRVARILRVSERHDSEARFFEQMMGRFMTRGVTEPEVETTVLVSVDFALAPQ